jgi:hypothetical protein
MHIKDFFNTIDHKFRNARVLDNDRVEADLINYANEVIGKLLYEIKDQQQVKGIECYIGAKNYTWGEPISDDVSETKTFPEILSIIRGLLESKTLVEIIDDREAEKLINSYKTSDSKIDVPASNSPVSGADNQYIVSINVTFSGIAKSATMNDALSEFRDRLKLPNNIQYKITNESVEINYK